MSRAISFTPEDTIHLVYMATRRDSIGCSRWVNEHIRTRIDTFVLLNFLSCLIARAKSRGYSGRGLWWIEGGDPLEPHELAAVQMVTAALNKDKETLDALVLACVSHPEPHIEHVMGLLLDMAACEYGRNGKAES